MSLDSRCWRVLHTWEFSLQVPAPQTRRYSATAREGVARMNVYLTCPHCHQLDWVQSVPALHADGVSTSFGTGVYSGVGVASTGLVPVFGTATVDRTHTTALAQSLAREPARTPAGWLTFFALVLLVPALSGIAPAVAGIAHPVPGVSHWVAALAMVMFLGG